MNNTETQAVVDTRQSNDLALLVARLSDERAADVVEALNEATPDIAAAVLLGLPCERAVEVLDQPGLNNGPEIVARLPREAATSLLSGVPADRLADLCRQLDEPHRSELLERLDPDIRVTIQRLLAYPPDTAGSIVSVPATDTVQQTLDYIRQVESARETVYPIYLFDPATEKLVQAVCLRRLIIGDPHAPVLSIARPGRLITVSPLADREDVARLISKYDLLAVPVVDHDRVIGIVIVDDVIDAIVQEMTGPSEGGRPGSTQRALHEHQLLANDQETGRMARRAVSVRNAYGIGDANVPKRIGEGDRPDPVHSTHHEFWRQFGFASDVSRDPGLGFA
jgi:Mg/Co/Ni transporter MgtE